jgi:glycerol uptake facilitator-like aquaporin
MNPARSIAPAVVSGNTDYLSHQWIYVAGPVLGAIIAVLVFKFIKPNHTN